MLSVMILLTSCCRTKCEVQAVPYYEWPIAGKPVAEEISKIPYNGYEDFWEWLSRLRKLQLQIESDNMEQD